MNGDSVQFLESRLSKNAVCYCARVGNLSFRAPILRGHCIFLTLFAVLSILSLVLSLKYLCIFTASVLLLHVVYFIPSIVIEESLTVMHGLGIQFSKKYLLGNRYEMFIEKDKIEGIFIHEYIYGAQIRNSLAVIVGGQETLMLVFKYIYPGFESLKKAFRSCKNEL